jgi:flagellar hook protein FlgE
MTGMGFFQPAVLGMSSQSHALGVISTNIANVTTNGYKRTDTNFRTVLSGSVAFRVGNPQSSGPASVQTDLGGVRPADRARVSLQGAYKATGRDLDLAISGRGFFVFNENESGSGQTVFGRDGELFVASKGEQAVTLPDGTASTVPMAWLVDKNGYFLQGWSAAADGSVPTGGTPGALRVDPNAVTLSGAPTTGARLAMNLPAGDPVGSGQSYAIDVFDSGAIQRQLQLSFDKVSANSWSLDVDGAPLGTLTFGPDGALQGPTSYAVAANFPPATPAAAATTASFNLDLSGLTQFAGSFITFDYSRDGYAQGALTGVHFDQDGDVIGDFDNGHTRPLYRLAIADFVNPDGLEQLSGNVFVEGADSGPAVMAGAGQAGLGVISPGTVEQSNVDLAGEFNRMILTQNAYNSSATAFRTLDEMLEVCRDLR